MQNPKLRVSLGGWMKGKAYLADGVSEAECGGVWTEGLVHHGACVSCSGNGDHATLMLKAFDGLYCSSEEDANA